MIRSLVKSLVKSNMLESQPQEDGQHGVISCYGDSFDQHIKHVGRCVQYVLNKNVFDEDTVFCCRDDTIH